MRVLLIIPYISDVYGGTGRVVREIAQALGDRGLSVDVVSTDAHDQAKLAVPLHTWIVAAGYRMQYFACWHRYDQTWSLSLLRWLQRHLPDYDLVHAHTLFSPLLTITYRFCRQQHIPYIMTPHGMLEPWAIAHRAYKKALYLHGLELPALRRAAAIQVLTAMEAAHLDKMGLPQTWVIPNGIHTAPLQRLPAASLFYAQFPETAGKHLMLFLSRLDPKKGLDLLAPAFAAVQQQFPNTHLVIAGPDSVGYLPTVQNFFATAGCSQAVTFTGMLSGEMKQAALQAAQLYVLPSYSEGFSVSVLEAMAAGLPCVITTGCNFPEAAIAGAAQVVPAHATALENALLSWVQQPQAAIAAGQKGQSLVRQNYTWSAISQRLIELYEKILTSRAAPAANHPSKIA